MKKASIVFIGIFMALAGISFVGFETRAASMADNLSGRILLQVESKGEAWWVNPVMKKRHYLGRPHDAFAIMREQGLGISEADIAKIPIGLQAFSGGDADGDGLTDLFEDAVGTDKNISDTDGDGFADHEEVSSGYNPLGIGAMERNQSLVNQVKGRIVLQAQRHGEAWYVSPVDSKRYFLGRPADAFEIMRRLGLGITNQDLAKITVATGSEDQSDGTDESGDQLNDSGDQSGGQTNTCVVTGCSGQLCAGTEMSSTCEYKEEYACYQIAKCERQANGQCGWTSTAELAQCITDAQQPDIKEFTVQGVSFSFTPSEIRVKRGDTVRINFTSVDGTHDWVLDQFDAGTARLGAGQSGSVEFVASAVGTFEYYCSVGSHRAMGMKGNLIVE